MGVAPQNLSYKLSAGQSVYIPTNGFATMMIMAINGANQVLVRGGGINPIYNNVLVGWVGNPGATQGAQMPEWNTDGSVDPVEPTFFDVTGYERVEISNNNATDQVVTIQLLDVKLTFPSYKFLAIAPGSGINQPIVPVSSINPLPILNGPYSISGILSFTTVNQTFPIAIPKNNNFVGLWGKIHQVGGTLTSISLTAQFSLDGGSTYSDCPGGINLAIDNATLNGVSSVFRNNGNILFRFLCFALNLGTATSVTLDYVVG